MDRFKPANSEKMYRRDFDSLEGFDRINNKYLDIDIINPRTHIKREKATFTDYEIHVKTNHPEFALKESRVRRRYSEFVWLKQRLGLNDVMMITAPSLPGKQYIGRFKDDFLHKRQLGLQNFMNKVIEINAFLSEPALHLFLQSNVSVTEMESHLQHANLLSNIRDIIIQSTDAKERKERRKKSIQAKCERLRRSLSLDSLSSNFKMPKNNPQTEGGKLRGWSRYIGEGYHSFAYPSTDTADGGEKSDIFRQRSITATTACVLPGGQIRLAGTSRIPNGGAFNKKMSDHGLKERKSPRKRQMSSSWHGHTRDLIDFLLDDYEVISPDTIISLSESSTSMTDSFQPGICDSCSAGSSDDGIEVDITERLKEYNIISMHGNDELNWDQQYCLNE